MIEQEVREKEEKSSRTEENGTQPPPQEEGKKPSDEKKVEKEQLSKVIYEGRVHHEYTKHLTWCLPFLPDCFTA